MTSHSTLLAGSTPRQVLESCRHRGADTRNVGYPGTTNQPVNETLERFLIPKMFAQVAQGKLSTANSVCSTASEMNQIWAKWKTAGKV